MCDTAGKMLTWGGLFAKNSDRKVNEPQVMEYYAPKINTETKVMTSYIQIDQVGETFGHVLSRPVWLWGGEMGVNECGVAIGNEAVFTKGPYSKEGLTGMDLLRLGLERGATAKQALYIITTLLERYGQGGNCSYEGKMYYDNSFIIMDQGELYVLETHGKRWAYKRYDSAAISNELTLRADADAYDDGEAVDFKGRYSNYVKSAFVLAASRRGQMEKSLDDAQGPADMMAALSNHGIKHINPMKHMMALGPCMHAGPLNADATTASIVAVLKDSPRVWVTGSSAPCISLFKPWSFSCGASGSVHEPGSSKGADYWYWRESFNRQALGKKLPKEFYAQRQEIQNRWIKQAEGLDDTAFIELSCLAVAEERDFYGRWRGALCVPRKGSKAFLRFWRKKDEKLNTDAAARKAEAAIF